MGRTQRRRVFNEGYFSATEVMLPAGRYIAFARHQTHRGELTFDLRPGEIKSLSIVAAK